MKNRGFITGIKCFACVLICLLLLLVLVDKMLPLLSLEPSSNEYQDGLNPVYMRFEKTPVESLLTVEASKGELQAAGYDISDFRINAYPIIDDMISTEKTGQDTVEIVVFGDSFVWGDASLNRNELFWRQAERQLRTKGYDCRVVAIGMGGATAYEELTWYKNYLKDHTPDLVVFGYVHNDALINGNEYGDVSNIDYAQQIPVLKPIRVMFPNIYARLSAYFDAKTMYSVKYGDHWGGSDITVLKGDVREYYQKNFADELDAITKETKIPSIVMSLPNQPRNIMYRELYKPLTEIYEGSSVRFYELSSAYDKYYTGKQKDNLFVNPKNRHPGSAAHYFYASFLVDKLETDFKDVLGKKSEKSLLSTDICVNDRTPYQIDLEEISHSPNYAEYTFHYPEEQTHSFFTFKIEPYWLTYPIGKGYIKLCFENPVHISSVEISGAPGEKTELYYTKVNERLGYDDNKLRQIRLETGENAGTANVNIKNVTSLCIHIDEDAVIKGNIRLAVCS